MRAGMTVCAAFVALMALGAVPGLAQKGGELDPADRVLIHGYDSAAIQLLWAKVLNPDAEEACMLDETHGGVDNAHTYEIGEDGPVEIEGRRVTPPSRPRTSLVPQGQSITGRVVPSLVRALKDSGYEGGLGCYIVLIARSDYGKGDRR